MKRENKNCEYQEIITPRMWDGAGAGAFECEMASPHNPKYFIIHFFQLIF